MHELEESQRELTQLCTDLEPEFLRLGGELEALYNRARRLSEEAGAAVCGEGGQKATDLFREVRDIFNASLGALNDTLRGSQEALNGISAVGRELEGLRGGYGALERMAVMTRMLGISTRIESGRLGDAGSQFGFLSGRISSFSEALYNYASTFEEEVRQVLAHIEKAGKDALARLRIQQREYDRKAGQIVNALNIADAASSRTARLSEEMDRFSAEVLKKAGEMVSALQFQDITRQQIEHVQAALTEIEYSLDGKDVKKCPRHILPSIYANLAVQVSQLYNVRSEIAAAGRNMAAALEGMAREIREHAGHIGRTLGETDKDADNSALTALQPQMQALGEELERSFLLSEVLFEAIRKVSGLVERVGGNQEKINKTRMDMKMLALNAQVQAARLGYDGRAFSVLAEDMQHLSDSWSEAAEKTASLLQKAVGLAADLEGRLVDVLERCRGETRENRERAANAVGLLEDAGHRIKKAVESISQASQSLDEEVSALVSTIEFSEIADTSLERVVGSLERLQMAMAARLSPEVKGRIHAGTRLDSTVARYTMESERATHANALQPGPADTPRVDGAEAAVPVKSAPVEDTPGPADLPMARPADTDDLGDNVELF
ncbi:MAG: methyl-accepting chemotaxis protein [Thermodesulfobacteriota bacterium]